MAKQSSLFKTIATILATSAVTLSVAVGAVVGRALNKQNQNSQIPGQNGQGETLKSIDRVEKTNTYGLIDEYTIYYTDGSTSIFIVTNGSDGQPGAQGFPGRDGVTPTITIENGKWVINGQVTELDAVGPQGPQGPQGPAGQNGLTPYIGPNGHWWIGETDTGVQARGMDGEDGYIPLIGENGNWWIGGTDTGVPAQGQSGRGIQSIEKTDSQGLIDVYTITYTDGTTSTFLVTNGADGSAQGQGIPGPAGHTPVITVGENGNWFVDGVDTGTHAQGPQGQNGQDGYNVLTGEGVPAADLGKNGDSYIDLLSWDYYVMDNGAWTKVGNIAGANGVSGSSVSAGNGDPSSNNVPGNPGDTYIDLSTGDVYHMGDNGEWGSPDANSNFALPHVGANGNWWVGDEDTGVAAQGPAGQDGASIHTGSGNPSGDPDNGVPAVPGNAGDTYIDLSTGDVYHMGDNGEWGSPDSSSSFAIPHIGENGHWYVGETDTGINATGPQGPQGPAGASVSVNHGDPTTNNVEGKQGDTYIDLDTGYYYTYDETNGWVKSGEGAAATSVLTGSGEPANTTGKDGDSYINLANWDFYVKEAGEWNLAGNIKGADGQQGAAGNSVNVGHGDPTTGNVPGNAGDTYIDLDTGNYYTMTNEGWGEPAGGGAIGTSIRYGNTAPDNSLGNNGDSYINTATWDYYAKENGVWVLQGNFAGQNGTNGVSISSVEKTGTSGLVDTYTITYSDNTSENPHVDTFTVTNGADGNKIIVGAGAPTSETTANEGDNYIDVETWKLYVKGADDWTDKGSFKGDAGQDGVSIVSVALKESNDLVDTYEITYSDSTATDPHVDNFYVTNGKDGTSVRTGHRDPRAVADDPVTPEDETLAAVSGIEGDSFIDLDSWNYYVLTDDGEGNLVWNPEGNLHYSPNRYTVTFDSNGGSAVDSYDEALEGFTILNPTAPTQDGYFFQGWYTSEGTRWDFSKDIITQDTTLTARWGQFVVQDGLITDCSITSGDVVIPEFYDNQLVVGIGDEAFKGETGITSFTLPHTVKSIGNSAFEGCTGLTSVVIPSNVKSIGNDAFKDCSNVAYVYIEEGAANPGISTLRSLPQTNGLESIGAGAFSGCSSLRGIVLPSTVKSIGKGAFEDCDSLESYTAPFIGASIEGPTTWTYCYGAGNPSLNDPAGNVYLDTESGYFWIKANDVWNKSDLAIPVSMTVNGVPTEPANENDIVMNVQTGDLYAYQGSSWVIQSMNILEMPDMKAIISEYSLDATYLSFVFGGSNYNDNDSALPSSLKTVTITGDYAIDTNAMNGCEDIETIIISGNPSSIGFAAFAECDNLKSITIPYVGKDSSYIPPLTYSYGSGNPNTVNPTTATYFDLATKHYWQFSDGAWVDLTARSDEGSILDQIVTNPTLVIGTDFPESGSFLNCQTGDLYVYYGEAWMAFDNLMTYAVTASPSNYFGYIFGSVNYNDQDDTPDSLETVIVTAGNGENRDCIPSYAFYECEATNIVLPNNVREIGDCAFGRTKMTSFVIPDSVEYVGKGVFKDTYITEITLPFIGKSRDSLSIADTSFEDYLFDGSCDVETVILTGANGVNGDTIPDYAFASITDLKNVILCEGITKIGAEAFHFCTNLERIDLPSTLKVLGQACFYQTKIRNLSLPLGLTTIEAAALADTKLTSLVIPGSVTTIGQRAFYDNDYLKSIVFQDGNAKTFGNDLFLLCTSLEYVYLGYGITKVEKSMFADVKSLKNVGLAESITVIEDLAFKGCYSLKAINLPANLESIGIQAFYHCTDLEYFNMPDRVSSLGHMAFEGCISLKSIKLSESLTSIDVQTFEDCMSLVTIVMPSYIEELGTRAFFGCTSLKYAVLNDGLQTINEFAFTGCDSLESIIIPDSVRNINRGAFSTGLTRKGNFYNTYSPERTEHAIVKVTGTYDLPNDGEVGDVFIFTDDAHYGEIYVRISAGRNWTLRGTIVGYEIVYDYINPASVEAGKLYINAESGDYFVDFTSSLTSITVPMIGGSADSIGEYIYSGALAPGEKPANDIGNDNDLYIDTTSSSIYRKINGEWQGQVTFTLENGELGTMDAGTNTPDPDDAASYDYYINTDTGEYWYKTADDKWGDSVGHIQDMFNSFGYFFVAAGSRQKSGFLNGLVPETLKIVVLTNTAEIGDGAFAKCSHIETVILPNTLTSIGNTSFEGCTSLKSINVPNSVLTIGNYAFANCTKLNAVNLGNNVKSIGDYAFMNVGLGWERSEVRYGHGDPINTPASMNGDFYVDVNTGELYIRQNDVWRKGKITITFTDKYSYEFEYEPASQGDFWGWQNWYDDEQYDMYVRIGTRWEEANLRCYCGHGAPTISCGDRNGYWYVDLDTEDLYVSCNGVWEKGRITPIAVSNGSAYEYYQTHDCNPNCEYHIDTTFSIFVGWDYNDGDTSLEFVAEPGSSMGSGFWEVRMLPGHGAPVAQEGEKYVDVDSGKIYILQSNNWVLTGNVTVSHGAPSTVGADGYYFDLDSGLLCHKGEDGFSSIVIPNSVRHIGFGAFEGCDSLETMAVPFVGGSYGVTYNYGHGAPTNSEESEVYFDIDGRTVWYKTNGQWEEVDFSTYGLDISVAPIGEGAPSGTANDDDCYIDYTIGSWYRYYSDINKWFEDGSFAMEFDISSAYFAYIFGAEIYDDQNPYDSKVPDSLKTVVINSGTKFITPAIAQDVIYYAAFAYCDHIENIVLPDDIVAILGTSFYHCEALKQISLPNNLETIADWAFVGCIALESIVFPDKVEFIAENAFQDCSSLTYAVFSPNSNLDYMGSNTFSNCVSLKSFVAPNGTKTILNLAFENCSSLESLIIPNTVEELGNDILQGCSSLKYLSVPFLEGDYYNPDFKTGLSGTAISPRDPLDSDIYNYFYNNVTGDVFFRLNDGWHLLYHHDNFVEFAFSWDNSYTYPSNPSIGTTYVYALGTHDWMQFYTAEGWTDPIALDYHFLGSFFGGVDNSAVPATLKNVAITGDNSNIINVYAFAGCTNLETVTLPDSCEKIDDGMFSGCTSLKSFTFGENIKTIGDYAFKGCDLYTTLVIPDTITSIGLGAFQGWNTLENIVLPFTGSDYEVADPSDPTHFGYIFGADDSSENNYYVPANLKNVVVTKGTYVSISDMYILNSNTFAGCSHIKSISVPDSVSVILEYAFKDCSSLTNVTFGDNPTVEFFSDYVFSGCSSLETFVVPKSVQSFGIYTFENCTSLKYVAFVDGSVFAGMNDGAFAGCSDLVAISLPDTTMFIGPYAFKNCTSLETVVIPSSVTYIYEAIFNGCTSLKTVSVPYLPFTPSYRTETDNRDPVDSDDSRDDNWIWINTDTGDVWYRVGGDWYKSLNIKNDPSDTIRATASGSSAPSNPNEGDIWVRRGAYNDEFLYSRYTSGNWTEPIRLNIRFLGSLFEEYVTDNSDVPDSLKTVIISNGEHANYAFSFAECSSLETVILPDDTQYIGCNAFDGCTSLKSFAFGENIKTIGDYAFKDCNSLEAVALPNNAKTIGAHAFDGCASIKYIVLNEGLENIGESAFRGCDKIESIVVPNSVTSIGFGAFKGCNNLTSITIPFVGDNALSTKGTCAHGEGAPTNDIESTVYLDTVGKKLYQKTSGVWSCISDGDPTLEPALAASIYGTTLPDDPASAAAMFINYETLDAYMPAGSGWLLVVNLAEYLGLELPSNSFFGYIFGAGSSKNQSSYIPYSLSRIILTNANGVDRDTIPNHAFYGLSEIDHIILPQNYRVIGTQAFAKCSFTSFTLPDSVTSVGLGAFAGCDGLETFIFSLANGDPTGGLAYLFVTNPAYESMYDTLPSMKKIIVTGGTSIPDNMFAGLAYVERIVIPDSVQTIGTYAFGNCNSLLEVKLPENITSIGESAFEGCSSLKQINIPKNVTAIENKVFYECTSLEWVDAAYGCSFTSIGEYAFYCCTSLKNASVLNAENTGTLTIGQFAFYRCTSLSGDYTIRGITEIRASAFEYSGIEGITFVAHDDDAIIIGIGAFKNCFRLESFITDKPNGTITIGHYAFQNCISLEDVMISNNATIQARAFFNCSGIRRVFFGGASFSEWETFRNNKLQDTGNDALYNAVEAGTYTWDKAILYCYSANEPVNLQTTDDGKYWRITISEYGYYSARIWYK